MYIGSPSLTSTPGVPGWSHAVRIDSAISLGSAVLATMSLDQMISAAALKMDTPVRRGSKRAQQPRVGLVIGHRFDCACCRGIGNHGLIATGKHRAKHAR